jgi:Arc/MetJ family transcription regulator
MHTFPHQVVYIQCIRSAKGGRMRTTINLDEKLVDEAKRLTGMTERTALIHEGLRALIERESARRLARLGGTEPDLREIPRRRAVGE